MQRTDERRRCVVNGNRVRQYCVWQRHSRREHHAEAASNLATGRILTFATCRYAVIRRAVTRGFIDRRLCLTGTHDHQSGFRNRYQKRISQHRDTKNAGDRTLMAGPSNHWKYSMPRRRA